MGKRSRGYVYTIWPHKFENPDDVVPYLLDHVQKDDKIEYAVFGHENCPDTGKHHLQGYVYWTNAVTPKGAQTRLGLSHGQYYGAMQRGTHAQASDYAKKDANLAFVHGVIPDPEDRPESAWDYILIMLENGASDSEIMRAYPAHFGRCRSGIAAMRMELLAEKVNRWRDVNVQYIWGDTGAGKTRGVLESVDDPTDVYRVTDYKHPFDGYRGQSILLLEEFRSSLPIEQMLVYLDGYYCELPCRYSNKVSGWDTVYIVTNIPLSEQYLNVQDKHTETFKAFLRRIDAQVHMGHLEGNIRPLVGDENVNTPLGETSSPGGDSRAEESFSSDPFTERCYRSLSQQKQMKSKLDTRVQEWESHLDFPLESHIKWQTE